MKHTAYRITSFLLLIFVFVASFFSCYSTSYALPKRLRNGEWIDVPISEYGQELSYFFQYAVNQVGAIIYSGGDFSQWLKNNESYNDLYDDNGRLQNGITVDSETNELTYSADLVALIKQALLEYANETNPFKIENTYRLDAIPASTFYSKEAYNTFKTYCASHGIVMANPQGSTFTLGDITPYIEEGGGFVKYSANIVVYNGDWKMQSIPINKYTQINNQDGSTTINVQENYSSSQWIEHYDPKKTDFKRYGQNHFIVTHDGGRIRVFNSGAEFMDYSAGQRKIYFGSDFYDKEPGEIKVDYDELIDYMDGRYDKFMEDLKDIIDKNPGISEEDLEKLIDELLGRLGEIGGEIGGGQEETNGLLSGIASSLSGYFSSVLSGLEEFAGMVDAGFSDLSDRLDTITLELGLIYDKIGDMTEEEVSDKTDSLFSQLASAFSEIGDMLKGKFPFCLPNDIYCMLAILSGDTVKVPSGSGEGDVMICAYGTDPPDAVVMGNGNVTRKESGAPVFEIPFVIGSADIEEKIVIDLSPFEYISRLSRTLMTLYYCACLMNLTFKVIDLGKDLGED